MPQPRSWDGGDPMPALTSMPYPNAVKVAMALLGDLAPTRLAPPPDFEPPLIVVSRIGGQPNADDDTDYPLLLVSCYGDTYLAATALADAVQVRVLSSPLTEAGGVLIETAEVWVGEQEVP